MKSIILSKASLVCKICKQTTLIFSDNGDKSKNESILKLITTLIR